ncbi:glycosyltransferase [Marinilabilia salmonicolor]|uniref:Glycosyltransferase involved in cell wall biosynthesis n=1 Tax=Marinilabilia salmonicolor TaxID=989 RepID=A0A368UJ78_9BACT|nr:glycosyltransferase [Marinilabilia salmonicolor]RCW27027.1 glycosyltransferase involved in cell wall biosynthesis [Marinilabilia salmonicolor]
MIHNSQAETPLVSVCMITYNHEPYIAEAIEGVLMQKADFPFKLIIGEDHSTDNTRAICEDYAAKYPNIIELLPRKEYNLGMMPNFIRTLNACTGKYIALCEGDDYWTDFLKLQNQISFLEKNSPYSICHHRYRIISTNTNSIETLSPLMSEDSNLIGLLSDHKIGTLSCVFRNNLKNYNWLKEFPIGDFPLHLFNSINGKIKYFSANMATYRIHENGNWNNKNKIDKIITAIETLNKSLFFFDLNQDAKKNLNSSLAKHYTQLALKLLEKNKIDNVSEILKKAIIHNQNVIIEEFITQFRNNQKQNTRIDSKFKKTIRIFSHYLTFHKNKIR